MFEPLPLAGAYLVVSTRHRDERGWFARSWDAAELAAKGLTGVMDQSSFSFNAKLGTLRGLHYQIAPHQEAKLVTCVRGTIWDVIVDLRPDSPTFRRWHGEELDSRDLRAMYVPEGFAHGFLTLSDESLILYQISVGYAEAHGRGIRWDDPALSIKWPASPSVIEARDLGYPDFDPADLGR